MLLKNTRENNQFTYLECHVYPEECAGLNKAYLEMTEKPHGYLMLDFAQDRDDLLLFLTRIFPDEGLPSFNNP